MRIVDAVKFGADEEFKAAVKAGEDPNTPDEQGLTPLLWLSNSINGLDINKIRTLLNAGANPNAGDSTGYTPIASAVEKGRLDLLELFQEHGASLRVESDCGSLIADAVLGRQPHLITFLTREGADINLISRDGFTPLMLAAGNGIPEAIPVLLTAGARVDLKDSNHGLTAYMHAAVAGDKLAGRLLLKAGADAGATDNQGRSAVELAKENGRAWNGLP